MDGQSQRSRSGQTMFTKSDFETPFSRLRFDVDSLTTPLGGGGGTRQQFEGQRFGLPADSLLDDSLRFAPPTPVGLFDRLHDLVDHLPEDSGTF